MFKGKLAFLIFFIIFCLVGIGYCTNQHDSYLGSQLDASRQVREDAKGLSEAYEVNRIIDGDTIEVKIGDELVTVRMIGIDCPESVHPDEEKNTEEGKIASEYTRSLLEGKRVRLEYDEQLTDEYGRTLAYVYLEDDTSRSVNQDLLINGYARVMNIEPNTKYKITFKAAEDTARSNAIGFWADYYKEN